MMKVLKLCALGIGRSIAMVVFKVRVSILQVKHYLRTEASYPTPISSMEQ
jgi:hypothetical protein